MIKVGKWIAKHKILIIIIGIALLIPSYLGMAATRINYDVLSYLPDTLETVKGQDIMVDQFGMGAFSMIVVEDMELKDVGPGIVDIDKAMQAGYSTAPDDVRSLGFGAGMGLPNMKKNSDTMDIQTILGKGTTVTMTVNMPE